MSSNALPGTNPQLKVKNSHRITHCLFNMDGLLLIKCHQRFLNFSLMNGADRLIRHLHNHGIPMAVTTSSGRELAGIKMKNHQELFSMFHHKVMGSTDPDVKTGKPAPNMFVVAASRFINTPSEQNCLVFEDLGLPITPKEFHRLFTVLCRDRFSEVLDHLHKHGVLIGVVTSSSLEMAEFKKNCVPTLFREVKHIIAGATDRKVLAGKPAPDIFCVASEVFPGKSSPGECLVFDSLPIGIRSACLARMPSVLVHTGTVSRKLLKEATVTLHSLLEFKPQDFGLPAYDSDVDDLSDENLFSGTAEQRN